MSSRNPSGDLFSLMAPPMGPMPRGLGVSIAPGAIPVAAHTPRTDRHAQVRREYDVMEGDGNTRRIIVRTQPRDLGAWTKLMEAGATGCTPIDNPGPRWSSDMSTSSSATTASHRRHLTRLTAARSRARMGATSCAARFAPSKARPREQPRLRLERGQQQRCPSCLWLDRRAREPLRRCRDPTGARRHGGR